MSGYRENAQADSSYYSSSMFRAELLCKKGGSNFVLRIVVIFKLYYFEF